MATPNVIFNIDYHSYYSLENSHIFSSEKAKKKQADLKTRSDFVRCKSQNGSLFNYLTRPNASSKENQDTIKVIEGRTEYTEATEKDILNYAKNRPGSSGAFNENGDISNEQAREIRKELQQTQSKIWTAVISFEENYGKKYCKNKKDAEELLQATLKSLFAKSHLTHENICWFAAMHNNTDNKHIHLVFWEKEPLFTKKETSGLHYANRGKINQEAINNFKFSIANYFESEKLNFYTLRDGIRNSLKSNLKNDVGYYKEMQELLKYIKTGNTYQYAKLPIELQRRINLLTTKVIERTPSLQQKKSVYIQELIKTQQKYLDLCRQNQIPPTQAIKEFVNSRTAELYNKLGNDVCQTLKTISNNIDESKERQNIAIMEKGGLKPFSNSRGLIRSASITTRQLNSFFAVGLSLITTNFDNTFVHSQSALREQEQRKKQTETTNETTREQTR